MRALVLGGLIGLAVLAATATITREHVDRRPPRFPHHQLRHGRAELDLPPGTSSVFLYDERLWPTEAWAPAARDAAVRIVSGGLVVGSTRAMAADFVAIPAGAYRARIAGQGYRVARGASRLRIDLWPRAGEQPPRVRRRWPGWTP